jgi:hypothetical protein
MRYLHVTESKIPNACGSVNANLKFRLAFTRTRSVPRPSLLTLKVDSDAD